MPSQVGAVAGIFVVGDSVGRILVGDRVVGNLVGIPLVANVLSVERAEYEAMNPFALTEPSALRVTYIGVLSLPVTSAGRAVPDSEASSGALALLPSYTLTKS